MDIHTIGHSNQPLEEFLGLLRSHAVTTLADVRSAPYSRFAHFGRERLRAALAKAGIAYLYLGDALGGRPPGPGLYDESGALLPARVRATPGYRAGLRRLLELAGGDGERACVLCAEEDPARCHRTTLIAPDLEAGPPAALPAAAASGAPCANRRRCGREERPSARAPAATLT